MRYHSYIAHTLFLGLFGLGSIKVIDNPFPELPNVKQIRVYRGVGVPPCNGKSKVVGCWRPQEGIIDIDGYYRPKAVTVHEKCHAHHSLMNTKDKCHDRLGSYVD